MRRISILIILLLIILFILLFVFFPFGEKKEGGVNQVVLKEQGGGERAESFPIRNPQEPEINLGEKAGIAVLFTPEGKEKILYKKNINERLPFASLAKIMTAMVVIDNYTLDKEVTISREAVQTLGESGRLSVGERISIRGLLDLSLLVSSNDAASALAEVMGKRKFVRAMNEKAKEIGLLNTSFVNPHGLDEEDHNNNLSSAYELAKMTEYSIENYPLIWKILGTKEKDVIGKDPSGREIPHHPRNVARTLLDKEGILGGKTGYTEDAGETMILVGKPFGKVKGNIVIVILGVGIGERLQKSEQLYNWLKTAYIWQ